MREEINSVKHRKQIEHKIFELELKMRMRRAHEVTIANKNFCLNDEVIAKLMQIGDMLYKKMLELVAKIQEVEKKLADEPDFDIEGKLYCEVSIPEDDDFAPEIVSFRCSKDRLFSECDYGMRLEKCWRTPVSERLGKNLTWPLYCLIEDWTLSFPEILRLNENNVFIQIEITL